jgi:hypothetical protein
MLGIQVFSISQNEKVLSENGAANGVSENFGKFDGFNALWNLYLFAWSMLYRGLECLKSTLLLTGHCY